MSKKLKPNITNLRKVHNNKESVDSLDIQYENYIGYGEMHTIINHSIKAATIIDTEMFIDVVLADAVFTVFLMSEVTNLDISTIVGSDTETLVERIMEFCDIVSHTGIKQYVYDNVINAQQAYDMLYEQIRLNAVLHNPLQQVLQQVPDSKELGDFSSELQDIVGSLNVLTDITHPREE